MNINGIAHTVAEQPEFRFATVEGRTGQAEGFSQETKNNASLTDYDMRPAIRQLKQR
jgi:hypothetical protein